MSAPSGRGASYETEGERASATGGRPAGAVVVPVEFGVMIGCGFVVSFANAISHGTYLAIALALLLVACAVVAWRFARSVRRGQAPDRAFSTFTPAALGGTILALLVSMPVVALLDPKVVAHALGPWRLGRVGEVLSIVALASYLPFLRGRHEPERVRSARFGVFFLLTLVAGVSAIHTSPTPDIDVYAIQQDGAQQLLHGQNPYVMLAVPDTDPESTMIIPYVYPPLSVLTGAAGILALGDVRYPMLFAVLLGGLSLRFLARRRRAFARRDSNEPSPGLPSIVEDAPALYLWLTPVLFLVVERAWLDPIQVGLICAAAAAYAGEQRLVSAILFGLAISSKQSMFWLIPLVGFVLAFSLREWIVMGVSAAAPVVPFALANFARLKYGNFDFMNGLRPRSDALVFGSWYSRAFHGVFPGTTGFLLAALVVALASWRLRGLRAFALATLSTYLPFFLFNRWAFCNYYYFVTALAALAAASSLDRASLEPRLQPTPPAAR